jgi:hypothetical protein
MSYANVEVVRRMLVRPEPTRGWSPVHGTGREPLDWRLPI